MGKSQLSILKVLTLVIMKLASALYAALIMLLHKLVLTLVIMKLASASKKLNRQLITIFVLTLVIMKLASAYIGTR